ncbi:MAG: helix-turn-helix domain-containing protein [Gemmatimonadetes bacterium]|nr:helix-turn-helix domain-containing protein [Gemmatimonadota bacterium]
MDRKKKWRLESAGWRTGDAAEFLELSPDEAAFVDLKLNLSSELRERRHELGLSQIELAERMGSSQSRVARMEASDPSVTLDLLIRGLLAIGASRKEIAAAIGKRVPRRNPRAVTRRNVS